MKKGFMSEFKYKVIIIKKKDTPTWSSEKNAFSNGKDVHSADARGVGPQSLPRDNNVVL